VRGPHVLVRLRELRERFRGSLFYVPALYIAGAAGLAALTIWLDRTLAADLPEIPGLLLTTVDSARSILSTIAGATVTVAGVVFSLTVIAVQLASSQFSPRVLRSFLRDLFAQSVIGLMVATFTYSLLVLAATRAGGADSEAPLQNISVTVAIVLAVVAVLAIVGFVDHSARAMQVSVIIRRIAAETKNLIDHRYPHHREQEDLRPAAAGPPHDGHVVRAADVGYIQQVDDQSLLSSLPPGGRLWLETRVGSFVTKGTPLATVAPVPEETDGLDQEIRAAFSNGKERTMQQDVAFGIRQLVDVALRALSPSLNDPTTAVEVIFHLRGVLEELLVRDPPPRVSLGEDGREVVHGQALGHDDFAGTPSGRSGSPRCPSPR
jgi:uncharacterized membrane protein